MCEKDKIEVPVQNNKPQKKQPEKDKKTSKSQDDFKRRYFEYYDDIKISDRQDW